MTIKPSSHAPASNRATAISTAAFSAQHVIEEGKITVTLRGNADSDVSSLFGEYLRGVHAEAARLGVGEVVLDCRELYFLTSSCIKGLATWIKWLMAMEPRTQYKISFLMAPNLRWQERSFDVLCQMCPPLVGMTTS